MKQQFLQLGIAVAALVLIATVASAYNAPQGAPGVYNSDGPLTVAAVNQVKNGGLSVNTFQARKDAFFGQQVFIKGVIQGGTAATPSTNVFFGTTTVKSGVYIYGDSGITGAYQSDSLKSASGLEPICGSANGTFYLCKNTPPTVN